MADNWARWPAGAAAAAARDERLEDSDDGLGAPRAWDVFDCFIVPWPLSYNFKQQPFNACYRDSLSP
jgi:hypothetical protein